MKKFIFIVVSLFLFNLSVFAQPDFPKLTGRVVDNANLLTTSQKQNLSSILKKQEDETSNQIVVVTLKNLNGYDIADYGYQLGRYWKIGQKDKNNGVLLIVSLEDRKVRIEVGYGLEGTLTDKISYEIIEYTLKPEFKKGNYYKGILGAVNSIIKSIKGEYKSVSNSSYKSSFSFLGYINHLLSKIPDGALGILAFIIFMFIPRIIKLIGFSIIFGFLFGLVFLTIFRSVIAFLCVFFISTILIFIKMKNSNTSSESWNNSSSSFSSGSSSFSSSSSFSGGGGSFGGGGASGSW
ncbi:hypothetical protein CPU12_08275 [Malaciobacter molluscorum LMG 25693]|uniref:Phosphatase (TPM domain) n=1 Tax=Malaciobacter molluscorum LMG 25693 TaxID=870501 RepID=A0A2G1DHE2_9BACT|nr:TPM domain-containing protein [Malaciobacter molluscorum]AXX93668.1 putative phosphatase (TPM domain) [Malaciobacter molluscorum LMG 25693]PHO17922.1 hypothetical protein CPU12_08275 [Malaciobacter molluscorum LMG 25693]